jgi:ParB family chromosome partitioning protein
MDNNGPSLTKGLDAIFSLGKTNQVAKNYKLVIEEINVDDLIPAKHQPRLYFNDTELQELAKSIQAQGLLQPVIVRQINEKKYELIAGERRWRAIKLLGWTKISAIIKNVNDEVAAAFSLIENIQRQDLNPIEEAFALKKLHIDFGLTHEEVAERVGKSRSAITNTLRLLNLSSVVQDLLIKNELEIGHARALITLDVYEQEKLTQRIIKEKLTVRKVEELIAKNKLLANTHKNINHDQNKILHWNQILSEKLSKKVKVHLNQKGQGKVVVYVDSTEEVEWLIDYINKS